MNSIPPYIDELIAKHLAHETTREEMSELEAWLNRDTSNRVYYDKLEALLLEQEGSAFEELKEADWLTLKAQLQKPKTRWFFNPIYIGAAAILILGITGYFIFNKKDTVIAGRPSYFIIAEDKIHIDTLEDGTIITLNKHSSLHVPDGFNQGNRSVELNGEAYFEIAGGGKHQFIIKTSQGTITDIGTKFSVNTKQKTSVQIHVTEGEVQLITNSAEKINAKAGQALSYNSSTGAHTFNVPDENTIAFKTHSFEFKNNALKNIIRELNNVYDANITYDKAIENCSITVAFRDEKIETILDIIAETLNVKYRKEKEGYHLAGNRCN